MDRRSERLVKLTSSAKAALRTGLAIALVAWLATGAEAVVIDNGLVGDGRWQVEVLPGGETQAGSLDPVGSPGGITGSTDIIFDYFHYVDVGGGGVRLGDTTVTMDPTATGTNQVTSRGTFTGANGLIQWTAVSRIAPGSTLYVTDLTFMSATPLGSLRVIQYLDEDVLDNSDDNLVVIGTPGDSDFQLLTIDNDQPVGVSHAAGYATANNMTYTGWAADRFADLRSAITGAGATYSIPGEVDTIDLPPIVDPRFPTDPAFGPRDVTSAIAFDADPDATVASVRFSLGGAPTGAPPDDNNRVPEPASLTLLALGLGGFAWLARSRTRRE